MVKQNLENGNITQDSWAVEEVALDNDYKRQDGMLCIHENMPSDCWVTLGCKCTVMFLLLAPLARSEVSECVEEQIKTS
jgi:hypothetical protein